MPLPLDNNRWNSLKTAYNTPATDVVEWLATAYRYGMTDELLGDIINDVQHQGDTSEAMYPTASHLLVLAETCDGSIALQMIIQAGLTCASSQSETAVPCPPDLESEFANTNDLGRRMVLSQLVNDHDFDTFKYLLAALGGFSGHGRFGRIIEGFDLFENQFHHALLDEPFDDEL
ncbi:hypothetical protein Pla22_42430 [Rubripirellula amarantea]|uniref:Uncharacterized protein n=1 Tax=Rubripirellula amarantea TaxID=2527999 RepID=A0A5C5WMR1_9BACT|nr:hypothetical protein [Rubripirellula amarantea]TWT51465.1 hypothetical protein Pla22_42430 [Rubripirellula amarantea]